jgi:tetratricopeptide (TPR) repeat protein
MRIERVRTGCAIAMTIALYSTGIALPAQAQSVDAYSCGELTNAYGPYDYTDPADKAQRLTVVETYHFNSDVENLRAGRSGSVMSDLDYTLRAFPNHHRALWSVAQLELRKGRPLTEFRSADCYFERALRWRPGDSTVHTIYAIFLSKRGDRDAALKRYQEAVRLAPNNPEAHYNIGLLYIDLNQLDKAKDHAERAYALGYPLPGLRNRLNQKGVQLAAPQAGTGAPKTTSPPDK